MLPLCPKHAVGCQQIRCSDLSQSRIHITRQLRQPEFEIAHWEQKKDGLRVFTPLPGFGCSSTRSELCAGILALAADSPVHIATDSQAFLDKALHVLDLCKQNRNPRKPWGIQRDGDLWSIFHIFAKAKGHNSIKITKCRNSDI